MATFRDLPPLPPLLLRTNSVRTVEPCSPATNFLWNGLITEPANIKEKMQTRQIQTKHKGYLLFPKIYFSLLTMLDSMIYCEHVKKTVKMRSECSMKMPMTIVSYQVVVSPLPWTHNGIALSLTEWKKIVSKQNKNEDVSIIA